MLLYLHSSCEGTFFNTHNSNFLFGGILFGDPASFELNVSVLFECFGKSSFAGFSVYRRKVLTSLFHDSYHLVEAYSVQTVSVKSIYAGIHCSGCGICVSFDARNLYQTADRVTCQAKMMLQYSDSVGSILRPQTK